MLSKRLLEQLGESFGFDGLVEFTIEAGRPDSKPRRKLETIKEFPVTRISVNPDILIRYSGNHWKTSYCGTDHRSFPISSQRAEL